MAAELFSGEKALDYWMCRHSKSLLAGETGITAIALRVDIA
jgi:hypothetical protein